MATLKKKIYKVEGNNAVVPVRAFTRSQAIAHVARETYTASIPTQDELVALGVDGIAVQDATIEQEPSNV